MVKKEDDKIKKRKVRRLQKRWWRIQYNVLTSKRNESNDWWKNHKDPKRISNTERTRIREHRL